MTDYYKMEDEYPNSINSLEDSKNHEQPISGMGRFKVWFNDVIRSKIIWIAIGVGAAFWYLESAIHVFVFKNGNLLSEIFYPSAHEIWMRWMVIGLFILFGFYARSRIIKLKRAEQRTKLLYLELQQIFQTAADGMRVIDKDFNVLRFNETFLTLSGMTKDEAMDKKCFEIFKGPLCHTAGCPLKKVLKKGVRIDCEVEKEKHDGSKITCLLTATPFRGNNGELIGMVEDFKDITDLKKSKEMLATQAQDLSRSNADLEQFAYIASHDLQEPLRMIASYIQLLSRRYTDKLDADANDFIGYAVDGANRMQAMINDLLTYSRVGRQGKKFKPVDCTAALEHALDNLELAIKENGVLFTYDTLPSIMADNFQIIQLFQNLINNAIKFKREEPPRIHISCEKKNSKWIFSIKDNGIGIESQYLERIFTLFQRLHTRSEYPGTGIGLSISKKIVERHGGDIWVESEFGQGTNFYFSIPINNQVQENNIIKHNESSNIYQHHKNVSAVSNASN